MPMRSKSRNFVRCLLSELHDRRSGTVQREQTASPAHGILGVEHHHPLAFCAVGSTCAMFVFSNLRKMRNFGRIFRKLLISPLFTLLLLHARDCVDMHNIASKLDACTNGKNALLGCAKMKENLT